VPLGHFDGVRWKAFDSGLVGVAICPFLFRFVGTNHGVLRPTIVMGRVLARRVVTTADVATRQAETKVNPNATAFQTLSTARPTRFDPSGAERNLFEMRARFSHELSISLARA
jgi:hypothetical protein